MFDQRTVEEARKNSDIANNALCGNVDLIEDLVGEVQILENRLTGCESLYATLDRATDTATRELRGIMDEMIESRDEGRQWTAWECRIFISMVNTLPMLESISYQDFSNYAAAAGAIFTDDIEAWWMNTATHFPR